MKCGKTSLFSRIGICRAALGVAVLGLCIATAGATAILPTVHHVVNGATSSSSVTHTVSLVSFGGSSGAVNVSTSGTANVGLGVNSPLLGLSTTTVGVHLPGLLGLGGTSVGSGTVPISHTGTLNLSVGLDVPLLGVPQINLATHVPTLPHTVNHAVSDLEGILANPVGALLGEVHGVLYDATGILGAVLGGQPFTLGL